MSNVHVNTNVLGPMTLILSVGGAFIGFLPKVSEIRTKNPVTDPEFAAGVRTSELFAGAVVVGAGTTVSLLTGSYQPLVLAVVVTLLLTCVYEYIFCKDRPLSKMHIEGALR